MAELLLRALVCGMVVWAVVRSVDGAPPAVAAWIISLPMTIGAGFVAIAATQEEEFLVASALRAAQSMPALLAFILIAGVLFDRLAIRPLLAVALGGWLLAIALLTAGAQPWPLAISAGVSAVVFVASHWLLPMRAGFARRIAANGARRAAWPVAVQAAAMMILLSVAAPALGPRYSAWITAVPLAMLFVTLGMKRSGSGNAAATYQSARFAMPGLFAYLAAVVVLTPRLGGPAATLVAILPSLALSALIVAGRLSLTQKETAS